MIIHMSMLLANIRGKAAPGRFIELRPDRILATLGKLEKRIAERFPGSGLGQVCAELNGVAADVEALTRRLQRPYWLLRAVTVVAALALVAVLVGVVILSLRLSPGVDGWADWIQAIESAINEMIFLAIALFFLASLEMRIKRRASLMTLHRLRCIAHVVDMHQLTKDPAYLLTDHATTASSPERVMTPFELVRYLDYCSEMLSLTSKLAALHVQYFNDPQVLAAVNDLENLAHGLAGKIWQKIMIIDLAFPPKPLSQEEELTP